MDNQKIAEFVSFVQNTLKGMKKGRRRHFVFASFNYLATRGSLRQEGNLRVVSK